MMCAGFCTCDPMNNLTFTELVNYCSIYKGMSCKKWPQANNLDSFIGLKHKAYLLANLLSTQNIKLESFYGSKMCANSDYPII